MMTESDLSWNPKLFLKPNWLRRETDDILCVLFAGQYDIGLTL